MLFHAVKQFFRLYALCLTGFFAQSPTLIYSNV